MKKTVYAFKRVFPFAVRDKKTGLPRFHSFTVQLIDISANKKLRKIVMDLFLKLQLPPWRKGEKEIEL